MISRDAGREGACAGAKASPGKLTLLFFSYPLSISYFLTFPGRKGAGRGGEEGIPLTGLRYFPFVWSGYDIFSCEASLFRTHTPAHSLSYSRHLESHQKIHRHLTYCFISLGHATSDRQETDQIILSRCIYVLIRVKANAGKGGTLLGYDGIWGRWRPQGLERTYLFYRKGLLPGRYHVV